MKIKLIEPTGERVFYSEDIIQRISEINHELIETYPECISFCIKIEEVINDNNSI